jgi:hypothetical protein
MIVIRVNNVTKNHPINFDQELSRINVMMTGGVFHERLPGRGIARITRYEKPFYQEAAEAIQTAMKIVVEKMSLMVELAGQMRAAAFDVFGEGIAKGMKQDE